ncbi:chemotaxis protein CheW [Ferviditalea candida]|uniref:Chemotaxis protein CheW n=1 Tax=Ferviditalea candida TaxID=3108399 RepID=A0ABU5ZLU0_9BACL|nr:chemotaxis protein CheW [Paenibacillaceae bacterium T2]
MAAIDSQMNERQLVTFHLGDDEFGADIMSVKEIIRVPEITKVPNAPDYIEGACNLRGQVLPILDGRSRLNITRKDKDENSRVLVIDVIGAATGVVVDKVSEVLRVSTQDIEEPPQIVKNTHADYLRGVVKLDGGTRLIMLLDVNKAVSGGQEKLQFHDQQLADAFKNDAGSEAETDNDDQLVSFLLGQEEYAIGIKQVKEIIRVPDIMRVPNCEAYVEGVVSIRNHLLPIVNLRTYFGMENKEITDQTRILVVDMGEIMAGMMVDKVLEVLRIPSNVIQPLPKYSMQAGEQLKGVAKLNNGQRLIMLLEPARMISADQYEMISGAKETGKQDEETGGLGRQSMDEEHLVTFRIGGEEFGIKIKEVQEINRMTEVTKIPRAPRYIDGIVNLRGNIIPALDLRKFFGLAEKEMTDATRIIIVDSGGVKTGIVVDSVSEVLRFERSLIELPPDILHNGVESDYVEGVGKLDDGKRMILILNLEKVLSFQKIPA